MQVPHLFQGVIVAINEYDGASTTISSQIASLNDHLSLSEITFSAVLVYEYRIVDQYWMPIIKTIMHLKEILH